MRAIVGVLVLLMLCAGVQTVAGVGGTPVTWWQKSLGGTADDQAYAVKPTADGGCILVGETFSSDGDVAGYHGGDTYGGDAWVVKLDGAGGVAWQRALGGSGRDRAEDVQQTADGGYIIAGQTNSNDGDVSGWHGLYSEDAWVVKLNAAGDIVWQRCLGGSGYDFASAIQQTSDGGYVMAGGAGSSDGDVVGNHGWTDVWVVKLNAQGGIDWQQCFGGSTNTWGSYGHDSASAIRQLGDGGYIVAGTAGSIDGDVTGIHGDYPDAWVLRLDPSGRLVWKKCLGGTAPDDALDVQPTSDGGFIIAGFTKSSDGDVSGNHPPLSWGDGWVAKLDAAGNLAWQQCLGGSREDLVASVRQVPDGGYLVAGHADSADGNVAGHLPGTDPWGGSLADAWLVKLDPAGGIGWQRCLGGTGSDWANAVTLTGEETCIIAGAAASDDLDVSGNHGSLDAWVIKLGPPLEPGFTATPVTGLSPLAVQFADTSSPAPTAWHWDFGDGQTSATQSPSHAYANAGTYSVTLTVTYEGGLTRSVTKPNLVTVFQSLHAAYTVGSRIGYAPYTAVFTDETTGNPTTWFWEFGDGQTSTAKSPAHTFATSGNYTVRLTVSNPYDTKTATKTDYIRVLALWNGLVRVEAEDYDYDHPTEGAGYHDTTPGNSGGAYRNDDVDIAPISWATNLGYVVTDTAEGEWTRYWVTSPAPYEHDFPLSLRLSGWAAGQTITVSAVGTGDSVDVAVPDTGQASTYAFVNATLRLAPGTGIVRLTYHGSAMNVDCFTLDPSGVVPIKKLPGVSLPPLSLKLTGKFDDVNGNGRADFADVVLYFNQMTWIAGNQPVAAFDYNANGRIDFADVVWLFNHL